VYILSHQRNEDVTSAFDRYQKYLELKRDSFPQSAYALATSEWYFDPNRSKCPHDGWLEKVSITEPAVGERKEIRELEITTELLGAWHDGSIRFHYPTVQKYVFEGFSVGKGHGDWLYDEFRVSSTGTLIHEIEWVDGRWLIEAADVNFSWLPFDDGRRRTDLIEQA
jgi:hypothetical protein